MAKYASVLFKSLFATLFAHVKKPIQKTGRVEEPARRKGEMEAWQLICSEHPTPPSRNNGHSYPGQCGSTISVTIASE